MDRPCDHCGTVYTAKRSTSKYCTDTCRKAANRKSKKTATVDHTDDDAGLIATTRAELQKAGALDTIDGQAALLIARRIEFSALDSGSAVAALTRELRTCIAAATKSKAGGGDLIDQLRQQREQREQRERRSESG